MISDVPRALPAPSATVWKREMPTIWVEESTGSKTQCSPLGSGPWKLLAPHRWHLPLQAVAQGARGSLRPSDIIQYSSNNVYTCARQHQEPSGALGRPPTGPSSGGAGGTRYILIIDDFLLLNKNVPICTIDNFQVSGDLKF